MADDFRLIVNPYLEVSDFDAETGQPMSLCSLPGDGRQVRFAVPTAYIELVRAFGETDGETVPDAAARFAEKSGGQFTQEWLEKLVEKSLLPRGILVRPGVDNSTAGKSSQRKRAFLYVKLPIIGANIVDPIAKTFGFLFHKIGLMSGLIIFIALHIFVYANLFGGQAPNFNSLDATDIILLMVISTAGTLFHEFGHASAAAHYGCRGSTIGWGIYFIYTVLWTDVSEAWKLPRHQRAVVDIGGVYFETVFLLLLVLAYLATGNTLFLFGFVFVDISIAMTFNPFLRMDGYWLMSDLCGIVNLRTQQKAWFENTLAKLIPFGRRPAPSGAVVSKKTSIALSIYSVLSIGFLGYVFYVLYNVVFLTVLLGFPDTLREARASLADGTDAWEVVGLMIEVGWRGVMLFGGAMIALNLVRNFLSAIRKFLIPNLRRGGVSDLKNA